MSDETNQSIDGRLNIPGLSDPLPSLTAGLTVGATQSNPARDEAMNAHSRSVRHAWHVWLAYRAVSSAMRHLAKLGPEGHAGIVAVGLAVNDHFPAPSRRVKQ